MYLINFFCGFFVKLSSALAPPARPVRLFVLRVFLAAPPKNSKNKEVSITHGKPYIYIYKTARQDLRICNKHPRARCIWLQLFRQYFVRVSLTSRNFLSSLSRFNSVLYTASTESYFWGITFTAGCFVLKNKQYLLKKGYFSPGDLPKKVHIFLKIVTL